MNNYSLFENIEIKKPYETISAVTNRACLQKNESGNLQWSNANGETSGVIQMKPSKIVSTERGDFVVLCMNSRFSFYPCSHTVPFYCVDLDPQDIESALQIQIWCDKSPSSYAIIAVLTPDKLITYIYDNEDLSKFEAPSRGISKFTLMDGDYIYGWSNEHILRYRITKNGIKIYRRLPNTISATIKNIIAAPKFIICQTETHLISICNSSGMIIHNVPAPKLMNAMPSVVDGQFLLTMIFDSKIEIWKFDYLGKREEMIWSIQQNQITISSHGSMSVVYKSSNGTHWISRLSPEAKLERLVNQGELSIAAEFARRHNLDSELIQRAELMQKVKGTDFARIRELVSQIKDVEFLQVIPFQASNPLMKTALIELVATYGGDEDNHFEDIRQSALHEISDENPTNAVDEMYQIFQRKDFDALLNFIYKNNTKLTEDIGRKIIASTPTEAPSKDLISFINAITPLFIRQLPIIANNDLPRWIADRAVSFYSSEPDQWPKNAINLIDAYCSNLEIPSIGTSRPSTGIEVMLLESLAELNNKLKDLLHFKSQYNLDIPLRMLDDLKTKEAWLVKKMNDLLGKCRHKKECERTLTKFILPLVLENSMILDNFLSDFLTNEDEIPLECRVEIIKSFTSNEMQQTFMGSILQGLAYPWPDYILEYSTLLPSLPPSL